MSNTHPKSFACAIVSRKRSQPRLVTRIFSRKPPDRTSSWLTNNLAAFGLEIVEKHEEPIGMFADFEEEAQLTIVPVNGQVELWLGWPVAYMAQDMLTLAEPSANLPPSELDALFIVQDRGSQKYLHQYICDGKFGEGLVSCDSTKRVWTRSYRQEDWPPPKCPHLEKALPQFQADIGADEELIKRVYSGGYGKGRYGMAYHPSKEAWVMARSLPDEPNDPPSAHCSMLQELNPNSYAKKGKPFQRAEGPKSGVAFLRQADIIREVQQRAIAASAGFRFDQPVLDQALFQGVFQKFWVERSPGSRK